MSKRALITGVGGQDGSYLAEHLLSLGYQVTGMVRFKPSLSKNLTPELLERVDFVFGDLRDALSIRVALAKSNPDEIYNLGAQVFVPPSWSRPEDTFDVNVGGLTRILNIVESDLPKAKVYQASSSEMFGNCSGSLTKDTVMKPRSPYGVSKLAAHNLVRIYREKGLFVVGGILFNHESPRRGSEMVTRKITQTVAQWAVGNRIELRLGNLEARRDWGFAGDYVKAMHLMLQQEQPQDYVIGTGVSHSVQQFLESAIIEAEVNPTGLNELIKQDPRFVRTNEIADLVADTWEAENVLGWKPETTFEQLVNTMVQEDIKRVQARQMVTA